MLVTYLIWLVSLLLIWRLVLLLDVVIFDFFTFVHYGIIYWFTVLNEFHTFWQRDLLLLNDALHLIDLILHALSLRRLASFEQAICNTPSLRRFLRRQALEGISVDSELVIRIFFILFDLILFL